ncbi:hypothetical protein C7Y66_10760 [Chroococcidiopsis sp. CCALA 051]|nr:hypothetical protein C7Y66_10760 [Chroococcidiopsis sp. CCALA 051]
MPFIIQLCFQASVLSCEVELPPIKAGMSYKEVRKLLTNNGWFPISLHWSETESWSARERLILDKGYSDIQACSGTGLGHCLFSFGDGYGNKINITTSGQADNEPEDLNVTGWSINPEN